MKSLVIGADGQVGMALARLLPGATKTTHATLDITNYHAVLKVLSDVRPDVVYLAAAKTNVDACQDKRNNSSAVNVTGTMIVLHLCEMFGCKLVWFSSGYVFDGNSKTPYGEIHPTAPLQEYGKQKEAIELAILSTGDPALIVRTIGVFGEERGKKNFVKSVVSSVTSNKIVMAPIDQYMNPVLSSDLAEITIGLVNRHCNGIYHVAGDTTVNKFEFARMVADYMGREKMVEGVMSEDMHQRAPRPRMAALDCSVIQELGFTVPSFEKGLERFLDSEYG